jgi:hypothetical protein
MMLNLERALKQDRWLRALTGLNRQAFDALLPSFEQAYEASRIAAKPERQRAMGGGRKARLESPEAKLFYILFYFKCYPTFDLAGILFDLDRSQTHEWMHGLQPILEVALGEKMVLPARKLRSVEAFIEAFPGVERVMSDGTLSPDSTTSSGRSALAQLFWQEAAAYAIASRGSRPTQASVGVKQIP